MADLRLSLKDLSLKGVEETDNEIGRGAYGVVKRYLFKGLRCAGKSIHDEFLQANSDQNVDITDRFEQECLLLSKQRHPNIVLFMGVFFKGDSVIPALIMEELTVSLDGALTKYANMPPYIKNVILYDVACGLNYLHGQNPPVIHRDLSSRNVLLSENLRAKIADLGVARIVEDSVNIHSNIKLTKVPGNAIFMPPEALPDNPIYNCSLDMFSYGNIILNVVNQKWPNPTAIAANDGHSIMVLVNEVDRRKSDFDEMGETHYLRDFTLSCLDNDPGNRPTAAQSVRKLNREISKNPPPFTDALQMMEHISQLAGETMERDNEVRLLRSASETLQKESGISRNEKRSLEAELAVATEEISSLRSSLDRKNMDVRHLNEENESKAAMIHLKENNIEALKNENETLKATNKVSLVQSTASLNWKECASLPHPHKHVQAVEFKGKVYIGSGYSNPDDISHQIYCYDPAADQWGDYSESLTRYFAMSVFNDNLILIGGISRENAYSKQMQHLTQDGRSWIFYESDEMPDLPQARAGAVAVSYNYHLVVAGGYNVSRYRIDNVDVYERRSKMWFKAPKLPRTCAELKTAVMQGDQWYLLGGANQYNDVYTTSLKQLVDRTVQPLIPDRKQSDVSEEGTDGVSTPESRSDVWTAMAKLPNDFSFVSVFGGSLIALGGEKDRFLVGMWYSPKIHVYNSHKQDWVHLADMPLGLTKATALALSNGDLLIIGGRSKDRDMLDSMCRCKLASSLTTS